MEGMGSVLPRAAGLKQISTCYCSEGGRGAGRAGQALFLQDTKLLPLFPLSPFPPAPSEQRYSVREGLVFEGPHVGEDILIQSFNPSSSLCGIKGT